MSYWKIASINFTKVFGIPTVAIGICGNALCIFTFLTVATYRQTPSTFYLLAGVMANSVHLTVAMITRILMQGFNYDPTQTSVVWCKIRQLLISTYPPLGLTFLSLATIDQFLVTSRRVRLRQYSNIKNAHRIAISFTIFWNLHGVAFLYYSDIRSGRCIIINPILADYWSYIHFFCVLLAIPVISLVTFGFLTYKNMRQLRRTGQMAGADQQLVKMISLQLLIVVIATIPYGVYNAYILATSRMIKTPEQIDQNTLFSTVTVFMGTFNFGGTFYVYLAISSRFRGLVREQLFPCCKKVNRVNPSATF